MTQYVAHFEVSKHHRWYAPLFSVSGHWYFVSFIDDAARSTWVYMMKYLNELTYIFEDLHKS